MAKKKGPTEDEGILELGFEYDATGEQAAVKGAENVGTAIEKTGKKAKKTSKELDGTSKALADVGASAKPTVKDMKDVDDSLKAITKSAKEATKAQKELGSSSVSASAAAKKGWDTRRKNADIKAKNTAMATAADMKLDGYRYVESVTGRMNDDGLASRLTKIKTNISLLEEYTSAQDKANASMLASLKPDRDKIDSLSDNAQKIAALDAKMKEVQNTIDDTSSLIKKSDLLMSNATKNIESYTNVVDEETDVNASLKHSVANAVNEYDRMQKQLKLQEETQRNYVSSLKKYRDELKATEEAEKKASKMKNEQDRIALLDQQNQRLAIAKAEFDAMSTAAEKYKNTLEAAARVGATGYVPMATNVPYTPTGAELTSKLTDMGGNYAELKKVTDARQQSTAALIAEAKEYMNSASKTKDYEEKLKLTEMATEKLKEASLANKSALFDIGTLANQTGANLKAYTKYIQDNDTATLALKNEVVDLSNQLIDSRDGLRAQSKGIAENITNLNTERKSIIENIKAQKELEKARLRTQASQNAMTQLQDVPAGIGGVTSNLVARQGVNSSALADAQGFLAAADATNVYEDKLENLDSAYNVVNDAMKENKLAMASAKLTMEPLLAAYAEFKGDLDETDPKAKALKDTIEAMKKAYGNNMRALREQGIELESTKNSIVAEKKEWESLEKTARVANDKIQKSIEKARKTYQDSISKITSGMREVSMLAKQWGTTFSRYVTAPIVAAGLQAVKFTAQMEMNIKSLEILLMGNAEAAEELYMQVTRYAAYTPYEIPDLTSATKQLLAFGSASGDVMKELSMLGDLAQNDADKLASVTSAFGKVQARGVAHMRELNRFIMAGVPIIEKLGTVMGMSSDELFKAVEQGQVSFAAVKQAIEALTSEGERFHDMSEKLASTVKGRWSTLSDEINLALKAFADDYMPKILTAIEWVIDFARSLQAMSKSQRDSIKNWAVMAASIGPVLLITSKVVTTIMFIYKHISNAIAAQRLLNAATATYNLSLKAASGLVTGSILGGILLLATVIGGVLVSKMKTATKEFKEQQGIIESTIEKIRNQPKGEGYTDFVRAQARGLIDQFNYELDEDSVMKVLLEETTETAPIILSNMNNFIVKYNSGMRRLVADRQRWTEAMTNPRLRSAIGAGDPESNIARINEEIKALEKTKEEKLITEATPETYISALKRKLNIVGAAGNSVTELLSTFKYNTEEAIKGTLSQFSRFASVVPLANEATTALDAIEQVFLDGAKGFADEKEYKALLESKGIKEGSAAYNLMKYLMAPTEEDPMTAVAGFREFLSKVGDFTQQSVNDYIKSAETTFRKENLADIFFAGENWDKVDSALISKRADAIADAYGDIVSAALDALMESDFTLTIEQAFNKLKEDNEKLFAEWEQSLKTAKATKTYDNFTKIKTDYSEKIANLGKSELQQFVANLNTLKDELADTDYSITTADIEELSKAFSTLQFKEVEADLIAQKDALLLTSDALDELTYRQNNFTSAQIKGLRQLKAYTNTIKELQEISGKDTASIPLLGDLSKVSRAISTYSTSPWKKILDPEKGSTKYFTETTKLQGMTKEDYIALGSEISKAFKSITKEIFEADEATKQLIYSSNEYATFMSTLASNKNFSELFSEASIATTVEAAKSQLSSLTIEIENFGKSTEEIMVGFWEKILGNKEALKLFEDSDIEIITELIKKYKELIELQKEGNEETITWKDVWEDIGTQLRTMAFEQLIGVIEDLGEAWGSGAEFGQAFEDSIRDVIKAIIDALPQMLLQAGLNAIALGNWPIGLSLIAAAGASALLKGYVSGRTEGNKDGTTTPSNLNFSAKGDSFDRGRILNVPTVFNTASGLNIGGELGTEAILPLSRDSNGRLGVNVAGVGGGNTITVPVTVNIVNQSGVETEAEVNETTNADGGKNIEVIIKKIVNKGMANGEYDRTMKSRYGLSNRGVS